MGNSIFDTMKNVMDELFMPVPDIGEYLARINYSGPTSVCRETLDGLIAAHLKTVPFENLDSYDGDGRITLGIPALFDKIVKRRRGGFCFELNLLFYSLLRGLGFDCHVISARVVWGRSYRNMIGHCAIIVSMDGTRLFCDVGFGGHAPGASLVLDCTDVQDISGGSFAFLHGDGETTLYSASGEKNENILTFSEQPHDLRDFIPVCYFYAKSPDSFILSRRILNIRTDGGSVSINGSRLRINDRGTASERLLDTTSELEAALLEHFGIEYGITRL